MATSSSYSDVYVINACRTGVGAFYGQFNEYPAATLGAAAMKACLDDLHLHGSEISQVIMGQVATKPAANSVGRATAGATIPDYVPAATINMDCASGLKAVHLGFQAIRYGSSKMVICGGQENITMAPHSINLPPGHHLLSSIDLRTSMEVEGLTDSFTGIQMRERANNLAELHSISREMQDEYAYASIQKAIRATQENYFDEETVIMGGIYKDEIIHDKSHVTLEMLSQKPTLLQQTPEKPSTVSTGNSADLSDGAAVLTLCNNLQLTILGRQPLAKIVGFSEVSLSPEQMGIGSVTAIEELLETVNWAKDDVDLYEIQEVFAVQAIIVIDKLNLNQEKVNISGGAIALGHPIGASSARMLITLIYNLRRLNLAKGVASVCTGKGKALAVAIEAPQRKKV